MIFSCLHRNLKKVSNGDQKEIRKFRVNASDTRKSLVKGERFIRSVPKARIAELS